MSEIAAAVCGLFILMVPLAAAGLALINAGLGRSKNAAHVMTASLCAFAIAGIVYFIAGFGVQGHASLASPPTMIGGKAWSWIGAGPFFFRGLQFDGSAAPLAGWLQLASVGLASFDPARRRRRKMEAQLHLRVNGGVCRDNLSALCALGLGWGMAGSTRRELRLGTWIRGCRR